MLKKIMFIQMSIFIQFILINTILANDIKYYSPEGNLISKEEYKELSMEYQKKIQNIKKERIKKLLAETDEKGRPKYTYKESNILTITYVNSATKSDTTPQTLASQLGYDQNGNQTNDPIYFDSKGRPIYTSKGNRLMYSEEEEDMKYQIRKHKPWFGKEHQGGIIGVMDVYGNTIWERKLE